MTELVVATGYGCSQERADEIATKLGNHLDLRGEGLSLIEALDDPERTAHQIHDKILITNSSGSIVPQEARAYDKDVRPKSILAISPLVRTPLRALITRAQRQAASLRSNEEQPSQKIEIDELLHHPIRSMEILRRLANFDTIDGLIELQREGVPTQLVLPKKDKMLEYRTPEFAVSMTTFRNLGGEAIAVAGGHCDFSHHPRRVYEDARLGEPYDADQSGLDQTWYVPLRQPVVA